MGWDKVKLGEILIRRRDSIKVLPNEEYKLVTIKLYHKGVILRSKVKGFEIKSPMSQIKGGDFILSGIDARNGAFGIVPEELDGAIVTNDFWCLDPDENRINKDFLLFLTTTNFFDNICKQSSDGTTQRIRLQKDKFFNYTIFLPSVGEQVILIKQFKKLDFDSLALKRELLNQLSLVKQLRQAILSEAMQGKLCKNELAEGQETGQQLLERIKAEKVKLIKDKKLKKEKELSAIKPEEIPFEIPKDWVWCRLGEIIKISSGDGLTSNQMDKDGSIPVYGGNGINGYHNKYTIQKQTIVIGRVGYYCGCVHLTENEAWVTDNAFIVQYPETHINRDFLILLLKWAELGKQQFAGSQPVISGQRVYPKLIPIPPLTIQNQIAAMLEQLTKSCDDLENSIRQSQIQNEQLLQQVLKEALEVKEILV